MMSFLTSFCGFSEAKLGVIEGESLNRSSIPEVGRGVFSTVFVVSVFLAVDVSAAAETITVTKLKPKLKDKEKT